VRVSRRQRDGSDGVISASKSHVCELEVCEGDGKRKFLVNLRTNKPHREGESTILAKLFVSAEEAYHIKQSIIKFKASASRANNSAISCIKRRIQFGAGVDVVVVVVGRSDPLEGMKLWVWAAMRVDGSVFNNDEDVDGGTEVHGSDCWMGARGVVWVGASDSGSRSRWSIKSGVGFREFGCCCLD
jgi:hypothetical protein